MFSEHLATTGRRCHRTNIVVGAGRHGAQQPSRPWPVGRRRAVVRRASALLAREGWRFRRSTCGPALGPSCAGQPGSLQVLEGRRREHKDLARSGRATSARQDRCCARPVRNAAVAVAAAPNRPHAVAASAQVHRLAADAAAAAAGPSGAAGAGRGGGRWRRGAAAGRCDRPSVHRCLRRLAANEAAPSRRQRTRAELLDASPADIEPLAAAAAGAARRPVRQAGAGIAVQTGES